MARPRTLHPNQLLVTFDQAAVMLCRDRNHILGLIASGKLAAHPFETDRIARTLIEQYALNYANATPNRSEQSDLRQIDQPLEEEAINYGFRRA